MSLVYISFVEICHELIFNLREVSLVSHVNLSKDCMPDLSFTPDHFLRFICSFAHVLDARIIFVLCFWHQFEHRMSSEFLILPIMQIFDVCHDVDQSARTQDIRVVGQQGCVHYSSSMVHFLEVRVSEAEEQLVEL